MGVGRQIRDMASVTKLNLLSSILTANGRTYVAGMGLN